MNHPKSRRPRIKSTDMLDVAWPELLVIGAVALVAIGPKDLPKVMRVMGVWAGKVRRLSRDVRTAFDQLSYEAEIAEKLKQKPAKPDSPPPADKKPDA